MALVVIIDDDRDDIELLLEAISEVKPDVQCVAYQDPREAVKRLRSSIVPDFIFLDLNMPALHGYECLSQIKKIPALENCLVTILSTWMPPEGRNKAFSEGAHFAMQKPYQFAKIKAIVKQVFEAKGGRSS